MLTKLAYGGNGMAVSVMSVRQAAQALNTTPWRVRTMLAQGELAGVKRLSASGHERLEVDADSVERRKAQQDATATAA
jgi:hypothetical protein